MQHEDLLPAPAGVRRDLILQLLVEQEFVRVGELADRFGISEVTVRSDLDHLADRGLLRRVRGGASARALAYVPSGRSRRRRSPTPRRSVRSASPPRALVESGDTVILDVGTTTTAVAHALAARDDLTEVSVFTSSLTIAIALEVAHPRITVVVTGGTLRPKQHSLVDPLAGLVLSQIHARWGFLGCNGVDVTAGVTNVNLPETDVKRRMIAASQRRVVCADATKLGQVALAQICELHDVDLLLTDQRAEPELVAALEQSGVTVRIASADEG